MTTNNVQNRSLYAVVNGVITHKKAANIIKCDTTQHDTV